VVGSAVTYALAAAEANAAMGRIVAAPTAGASGILPGVLMSLKEHCGVSREKLVEGLVIAGVIGEVIASRASIAGATGGCQAECGSGAAMAAGAVVFIFGGNGKQIGDAVSIVFKNMLGLVCDPVAGLVEVPCIKRNAGSVVQCLLAAELALAGVGSFIPADEAIDAMDKVGRALPYGLRETAEGGLAVTPTAKTWTEEYFKKIHS
jgi:L-serine dehydratase